MQRDPRPAKPRQSRPSAGARVAVSPYRDESATRLVEVLGESRPIAVSGPRDARIAQVADRQRGRISRRQLLAVAVADRTIYRLAASGYLIRRHRGVYSVGHAAPIPLAAETEALLACGSKAVLSHMTAARMWEIVRAKVSRST